MIIRKKFWFAIALAIIIFLPPFAKYQEMRYRNDKLEKEISGLKEEIKRLEMVKARLETDITYVESKAREKIGVVRKGEIVIKEPQKKK